MSRRHKVSNTMGVAHFSAKFRIFYQNVGCIGGKLYCAQSRSKTLSFKTLEGLDYGISPNRAHQRATTTPYDGKLARFFLEL